MFTEYGMFGIPIIGQTIIRQWDGIQWPMVINVIKEKKKIEIKSLLELSLPTYLEMHLLQKLKQVNRQSFYIYNKNNNYRI